MWYSLSRPKRQIKMYCTLNEAVKNIDGHILIVHSNDRREILRTDVTLVMLRFLEYAVFEAGRKMVNVSSSTELCKHLAQHAIWRITGAHTGDTDYVVPIAHLSHALQRKDPVAACRAATRGDVRLQVKLAYFLLNHVTANMRTS